MQYAQQVAGSIEALVTQDNLKINHLVHLRAEVCSETLVEELETFKEMSLVRLVSIMDHTPGQRQFCDLEKFKSYIIGKNNLNEKQYNFHYENSDDIFFLPIFNRHAKFFFFFFFFAEFLSKLVGTSGFRYLNTYCNSKVPCDFTNNLKLTNFTMSLI